LFTISDRHWKKVYGISCTESETTGCTACWRHSWPFSVFRPTPKQVFGPRTAKSQPIWITFCTLLYCGPT